MSELPVGWAESKLIEVGFVVTGNTPSKAETAYYGDKYPWVKPPDLDKKYAIISTSEKLSEEGAKKARLLPREQY